MSPASTLIYATKAQFCFLPNISAQVPASGRYRTSSLAALEPALADPGIPAVFLQERSVDPRALGTAALRAAKHRDVDISSGTEVKDVLLSSERVSGVHTEKTSYAATAVVNCAGAWAGQIPPHRFPTRPVKGQMLSLVAAPRNVLRHVIRAPEVYLVPRSDGRIVIGSTLEEAGYDKRTDVDTIQRLHHAAIRMVPALGEARMLEAWAGLRPGTPDALPILGATYNSGILCGHGALPRWNPAGSDHGTPDGASHHGHQTRDRHFSIFTRAVRQLRTTRAIPSLSPQVYLIVLDAQLNRPREKATNLWPPLQ